ncbi:MAG: hemerythrin domain-containing protein [Dehalococcoidia bacterium]|nr:hemerythrin domain-containing protein [Dehalococcoidia bacterium]
MTMETRTPSATGTLRQDHIAVLDGLRRLAAAGSKITSKSETEVSEARQTISEIAAFLGTELELHLQKEEGALFPPMEAVMGTGGGPVAVMRYEHVDMRADSKALQDLASDFGDAAKALQNTPKLQGTIDHLCDLLTQHIHKEDAMLFAMADDMLSPIAVQEALAKMKQLDAAK